MGEWCKAEGDAVLLVEGMDDCRVLHSLFERLSVAESFGLRECGGQPGLFKVLGPSLLPPKRVVGVVLDADTSLDAAWRACRDAAAKSAPGKYSFQESPPAEGAVLQPEDPEYPRLGVWIMPDNVRCGMIEDFLLEMVDETSRTYVTRVAQEAKASSEVETTFKDRHLSKAAIHTYLAWQDEPGRPLGQSVTAKVLEPGTDTAKAFLAWIDRLFGG